MRPDEDALALDGVESDMGEITTTRPSAAQPRISPSGEIREVQDHVANRLPLDGIDVLLVAYLLDVEDSHVQEPGPDEGQSRASRSATTSRNDRHS
jgi:hypothetical protein